MSTASSADFEPVTLAELALRPELETTMSNPISVSLVTVCFNSVATIRETLESIRRQAYPHLEYIVVDGGSTDGTLDIIEEYRPLISQLVSEPDNGIYDAMNKGLRLATGDVVGIVNSDDYLEDGAVRLVVDVYAQSGADIICGGIHEFDAAQGYRQLILPPLDAVKHLQNFLSVPHPAVFVARDTYRRIGLFDTRFPITADYHFLLRAALQGERFKIMRTPLSNFRLGGASGDFWKNIRERRQVQRELLGLRLSHEFQFISSAAKVWIHQRWVGNPAFQRAYGAWRGFRNR